MAKKRKKSSAQARRRRCLIVERHAWETGGRQQQLQFVLEAARTFWGPGNKDRSITIRLFLPASAKSPIATKDVVISQEYSNGTRRTNGFPEMGALETGFVFFEEAGPDNEYDVWWQADKAIVSARYEKWFQGQRSQYGRGRLSVIVPAPVPRPIVDL